MNRFPQERMFSLIFGGSTTRLSNVQVQQRYSHDLSQISKNYAKPTVYAAFSFAYLRYSTDGFIKLAAFLGNS